MGLRSSPSAGQNGSTGQAAALVESRGGARRHGLWLVILAASTLISVAGGLLAPASSLAQTPAPAAQVDAQGKPKDRLLVEAKTLVYNRDTNVVSAEGNVQLYYQGRVLEADKVNYDRANNRVYAEGHAKLTEADGTVTFSDKFDLTDDFRSGFINSLSAVTKDKTFFSAPRGERSEGETMQFEKGTYTACAPCEAHPERPPLWQIKALKIIHKADEQMVYFEDAVLELYGVPIAYVPYMSAPDPEVTRKTGFLPPRFVSESRIGQGVATPFFWNLAPNYDVTLTPTVVSKQGVLGEVEWRHRLDNGSYSIQAAGIYQLDRDNFPLSPYGSGNRDLRGSIETQGKFFINQQWSYGWDLAVFSDKYFFQDYNVRSNSLGSDYIKESISTAYLTGYGDRSYFDLRGYRIVGLSLFDDSRQQPLVAPVLDYNRTFPLRPESSFGIGGEINIDVNLTSLSRTEADYESTGSRMLDRAFSLYDVCPTSAAPNPALPNFKPPSCFLRGVAGDYTRASAQASWQRKFIDPIGEVWTPFAFARLDGSWLAANTSGSFNYVSSVGSSTIANADQTNFIGGSNNSLDGRAVPGIGFEWRYPFVATTSWATHVIEPTAQIIARPNVSQGNLPNEDAQSLIFDDTTLFAWNKFSGYDRVEGGVRANAGLQYTMNLNSGGYFNTLFGQSYQVAGNNSFNVYDASNVGLNSGLETSSSDYVARAVVAPNSHFSLITKARLDDRTLSPEAIDVIGTYNMFNLTGAVQYSRYEPQPLIGFPNRREGVLVSTKYNFLDHYFVNGSATVDLNPYKYDLATASYDLKIAHPSVAVLGAGVGYQDDCTTVTVSYSRSYTSAIGVPSVNQTLLLSINLRTLAQVNFSQNLGGTNTVQDGVYK